MAQEWPGQPVSQAQSWPGQPVQGGSTTTSQMSPEQVPVRNRRRQRAVPQTFPGDPQALISQAAPGVRFNSGYRSPAHNAEVGGVANSYHTRGTPDQPLAYDLSPAPGESMAQLEQRLRASGLPFAELINEGDHIHTAWDEVGSAPGTAAQMSSNLENNVGALGSAAVNVLSGRGLEGDIQITNAVLDRGGQAFASGEGFDKPIPLGYSIDEWESLPKDERESAFQNAVRLATQGTPEEIARLTGDFKSSYQATENIPPIIRSLLAGQTGGGTGIVPYVTGAVGALSGLDFDAAKSGTRAAMQDQMERDPLGTAGGQLLGGLFTPGLQGTGNYIAGAQGAARLGRAGVVGGGYGAFSGAINSEGGDVLSDTVRGALAGAGTGVVGQRVVDRVLPGMAAGRPSAARLLSREGVQLTPGQMVSNIPVVGPALRTVEEAASTVPFAGAAISDARARSIDTFNRTALNRVLAPLEAEGLGARFPTGIRAQIARIGRGADNPESGYQAVEQVQNVVSDAYDSALRGVEVRPDQRFYDDLAEVTTTAAEQMTPELTQQLANVLQNRVFRNLEFRDSPMTGEMFKRAESELGMLAREQRVSLDPANRALARALDDSREVLRDLVSRQRPDRAPQIQAVNRAYSNLVPIEEAAGSTASEATEGVFNATQLSRAASRSQSRSARARGGARMQDLTSAGRAVLNSRIGDSGTATRGGVTALMSSGVGAGTLVNPGVAIPTVIGVSAAYSRPVQSLLNVIYRASDPQSASEALQLLARIAQRNPALAPYYQGAAEHVLSLGQTQSPASPQAQLSTRGTTVQ